MTVCNDECEQLAKFKKVLSKKNHIDILRFYQTALSSANNQPYLFEPEKKEESKSNHRQHIVVGNPMPQAN